MLFNLKVCVFSNLKFFNLQLQSLLSLCFSISSFYLPQKFFYSRYHSLEYLSSVFFLRRKGTLLIEARVLEQVLIRQLWKCKINIKLPQIRASCPDEMEISQLQLMAALRVDQSKLSLLFWASMKEHEDGGEGDQRLVYRQHKIAHSQFIHPHIPSYSSHQLVSAEAQH